MKPVLMIHAMYDEIFNLPLVDYTLTFDDGLYSQWKYIDRLCEIDTDKIFFVSTKYLCAGVQSYECPNSKVAHAKARMGNYEDFMTPAQVQDIARRDKCYVGGHGHEHVRLQEYNRLSDRALHMKMDTEHMMQHFHALLGYYPTKFCFPYNDNMGGLYDGWVRRVGITETYGRERVPVESLLVEHNCGMD
jgi:Polysaccharide deacetylase